MPTTLTVADFLSLRMQYKAEQAENEIPAPKDGKVAQVVVTKGATVGAGDTLVVLA